MLTEPLTQTTAKDEVLAFLAQAVGNDELAAEYLLLTLIGRVKVWV